MKNIFQYDNEKENKFIIKNSTLPIAPKYDKSQKIKAQLQTNLELLKEIFYYKKTNDFKIRCFNTTINTIDYNSAILFYDGMVDTSLVNNGILKPLMNSNFFKSTSILKQLQSDDLIEIITKRLLLQCQITISDTYEKIVTSLNHGECVLLLDTIQKAIIIDTKEIPSRTISKSENEMTIKGPSESFIENLRTNTALIRKFIKDENLIFEGIEIGSKSKTKCTICYMSNITNESIIKEVKRRISSIDIDYIIDIGELEQYIEDKTYILDPLILNTERPDKVAANLIEGRVAILMEGSPNALIVPAVFSDFTHSSEDTYIRHPYALLLRIFRIPAIILSIFLPGIYIAISTFHQEMIPTDLLLAIAGTREKVPFPMLIELLIMETAFEIIREASIRTPAPVGPTLGIVGTLILGQAIVSANIVSPILVIIVALTGISAFAIANFSLSYSFRVMRFFYIFLGGTIGFFGIALRHFYSFMHT